jgi:hypothetical protein
MAWTPRPYAFRMTSANIGTEMLAPVLKSRAQCRTRPVDST